MKSRYQKELNKGWVDNIVIHICEDRLDRERIERETERKLKVKEREIVFL